MYQKFFWVTVGFLASRYGVPFVKDVAKKASAQLKAERNYVAGKETS